MDETSRTDAPAGEQKPAGLYCKVSPKGAVSVYGLQRMPVTLYAEQWTRLLQYADELKSFMAAHDSELKRKPDRKDDGGAES